MTGVTLRYTWITWAMFILSRSGAHPPIREAIFKKMYTYHLDRDPWSVTKTKQSVVYYYDKI